MKALHSIHSINYKGFNFQCYIGKDGRNIQVCVFVIVNGTRKRGIIGGKASLKNKMESIIIDEGKAIERENKQLYINSLNIEQLISNDSFCYARFQFSGFGNYYNIYWNDVESPTGVTLVGGCSECEWEVLSKKHNKSKKYLSPTEGKMTAK